MEFQVVHQQTPGLIYTVTKEVEPTIVEDESPEVMNIDDEEIVAEYTKNAQKKETISKWNNILDMASDSEKIPYSSMTDPVGKHPPTHSMKRSFEGALKPIGYRFAKSFSTTNQSQLKESFPPPQTSNFTPTRMYDDDDTEEFGDNDNNNNELDVEQRKHQKMYMDHLRQNAPQIEKPPEIHTITDPDNSLLSFLSILSAQLDIPFEELTNNRGLPSPKVQGMLEIARSYLIKASGIRNINLNHIVYDDGQNGELRVKFAELMSSLLNKQSGGSAYGKRITGGRVTYYTSADNRSKNNNYRILMGYQRYFKGLYWIKNPRLSALETQREAIKRRLMEPKGNAGETINKIDESVRLLKQYMPNVLQCSDNYFF